MVREPSASQTLVAVSATRDPGLEIRATLVAPGLAEVVFVGTICQATVTTVESAVYDWLAHTGITALRVNLSGVEFMDARGVSLLLRMRRQCVGEPFGAAAGDAVLTVVGAHGGARLVLEVCGLDRLCADGSSPHR